MYIVLNIGITPYIYVKAFCQGNKSGAIKPDNVATSYLYIQVGMKIVYKVLKGMVLNQFTKTG